MNYRGDLKIVNTDQRNGFTYAGFDFTDPVQRGPRKKETVNHAFNRTFNLVFVCIAAFIVSVCFL